MKEVRIECRTLSFPLHDFGLAMRKGDVEFVPEAVARASRELTHAVHIGAVAVRYVERCKVSKSKKPDPERPLPPSVRMSRPNRGGMSQPTRSPEEPEERLEGLTAAEIRQVIREEVQAAFAGASSPAPAKAVVDVDALRDIVVGAVASATSSNPGTGVDAPRASRKEAPDEPVFIPSDIVDKGTQADIKVESTESDAGTLDAAAAALKKVKPKGTSRKAKKKE